VAELSRRYRWTIIYIAVVVTIAATLRVLEVVL
jgi:hypothetical protein